MDIKKYLPTLFALYLVAAVSSQSLLDLITVIIIILTIICYFKSFQKSIFNKKNLIGIEWAFIGYVLVVILGFIFNASKDAEWLLTARKFNWLILLYIFIKAIQTIEIDFSKLLQYLCLFSLPSTLYSLVSYIHGTDFLTGRDTSRITGLVNSATYHAHGNAFLLVIMLAGIYFCFKSLPKKWKFLVIVSTGLLGLSILLTFTRGIWLSLLASSLMVLFYLDWRKSIKIFLILSFVFLGLFTGWSKFSDRIQHSKSTESNLARLNLFKVNVQIWKEYPLLGIGYGENLRRNREYWDRPEWNLPKDYLTSHAHNQFLNVGATTGVFGLFFFLSFFFYFIIKNLKMILQVKKSEYQQPKRWALLITCFWIQIEFLLACLTDVGFEYAKIRALIILTWALVIALDQKPEIVIENKL